LQIGRVLCIFLALAAGAFSVSCRKKDTGPSEQVKSLKERTENLQETLDEKNQELTQIRKQKDELSKKVKDLQSSLDDLKARSENTQELEQKLSAAQDRVAKLEEQVDSLKGQLEKAKKAGRESKVQELQEQLEQEQKTRQKVAGQLRQSGEAMFQSGSYEEALPLLHAAQNLGVDDPQLLYRLGYCFAQASSYDNAAKCYLAAAQQLEPNAKQNKGLLTKAYVNGGAALARVGKTSEAIDLYEKATKLDDTFAAAYFNLGLLYKKQQGGEQDAIKAFRHHIALGGSRSRSARRLILEMQSSEQDSDQRTSSEESSSSSAGQ